MIITCPHCQTKYQVTFEAIGSAGRKVQCAHCSRAWDQEPLPVLPQADHEADQLFDAMAEDGLDEAMEAEEAAMLAETRAAKPAIPLSATPPASSPAEMRKRQADFSRRQNALSSRLPLARFRRASRVLGVLALAGVLAGGYWGRVPIVERYPDLAGVYEAVGLGVNVVGLDFADLSTLKTLSGGNDVLMVSAQILGLEPSPHPVPPVVVSLLDDKGHAVYEWSVQPQVRDLMAGERATFDTRLTLPPSEAVRVRLSFAGGDTDGPAASESRAVAPAHDATEAPPAAPADSAHAAPENTSEAHAPEPEAAHGAAPAHH